MGIGQQLSPKLRITLQNVSDEALWLADPGDHCGFKLVPSHEVGRKYTTIDSICHDVVITQKDLIQLKSAQSYSVELNLSEPRWHIRINDKIREIGKLAARDRFRIVC